MSRIPDYPFPARPLDGSEVMAGWQDGQQVALPAQTLMAFAEDLAHSTIEREVTPAVEAAVAAADRSADAAAEAENLVAEVGQAAQAALAATDALSVDVAGVIGRPAGVPLTTGQPIQPGQCFYLDRVTSVGKLTSIDIFDRAAGTIEIAVCRGNGNAVARVAHTTVQSQGGGVERRIPLAAPLAVLPGDVLEVRATADGLYTLLDTRADGAGYFLGPAVTLGEEAILGNASTNILIQLRFNLTYREQTVTADSVEAIEARTDKLFARRTAIIGRPPAAALLPGDPVQPGQIFFIDPVAVAGRIASVDVLDLAAGTIEIAAFRKIDGVWTRIGLSSVATLGGSVVRSLPLAAPFAVQPGDIACLRATTNGLFTVQGDTLADGLGCFLGAQAPIGPTAVLGEARTDVLIYARINIQYAEQAVTADAFAALRDDLANAPRGGSPRVALSADVRVPMLSTASWVALILYGQSNSTSYEAKPAISVVQPYANLTFGGGVHTGKAGNAYGAYVTGPGMSTTKPLVEQDTTEAAPGADGSSMNGETACTAAGSTFVEIATARQGIDPKSITVFASSAGHAGYSIAQLSKGSPWYQSIIDGIAGGAALAHAAGKGYTPPIVYWNQGGDDARAGNSTDYYRVAFLKLVADINADARAAIIAAMPGRAAPATPIHFLVTQIASPYYEGTRANLNRIQQAQYEAVVASPLVHYLAPEFSFEPVGGRQHLTNISHRRMGAYIGRAMGNLVIDRCVPDCLWPVSAIASGTTLRLTFRVPALPMVFDEMTFGKLTDKGFVIRDAGGVVPIVAVDIAKSGDVVEITLGRALGASPIVRHGMDYIGAPNMHWQSSSGCLRDSTADIRDGQHLWHVAPACQLAVQDISTAGVPIGVGDRSVEPASVGALADEIDAAKALARAAQAQADAALIAPVPATRVTDGGDRSMMTGTDRAKLEAYAVLPSITIGGRAMQPTVAHFRPPGLLDTYPLGLVAAGGIYLDTGEAWTPVDPRLPVQTVIHNGRLVQPTVVATPSLAVIEGVYLDTGERFPPVAAGVVAYSPTEIVVVPAGATAVDVFYKGTRDGSARYIRQNFYRFTSTDPLIDADVWRLGEQWECLRTGEYAFADIRRLGNDAETDTAIWVNKSVSSDSGGLVGGKEHGGEKEDAGFTPFALLDGTPYDLSMPRRGQSLEFFHRTICYDWSGTTANDSFTRTTLSATVVARITKRHRWSADGYQVDQRAVWGGGLALRRAYFGMGVVFQMVGSDALASKAYLAPGWTPVDISASGTVDGGGTFSQTQGTSTHIKMSGAIGVAFSWRDLGGEITRYAPGGRTFVRLTSGRTKLYPDYAGGATPTAGAIWDLSSIQRFTTTN
ncbi:hypothetical protein [Sphingomonas sp. Leaf25]|uniref:hypothetical protein n=1 Tax=Sphingomonas sp. Leaf25 TaxID=1735692 RepID=UPI0006FAB954|nr:hypothetical protein [Sphingomonas sp. Leaf25]KQN00579.1 hypothetical protein ASE78_05700 [Sphingomonas sp. Leaf25]